MLVRATLLDRRHRGIGVFVAGTRAVAQFGHRVGRIAEFLMRPRFVIIGMAASTVRRICGTWVRHRLCIALVAIEAIQRLCMGTWIVGRLVQIIEGWQPSRCPVTINTFYRGHKVVAGLTGRFGSVMAAAAVTGNACVIECCREPCNGLVAAAAIRCGWYVGGRLSGCLGAIVAARTGSQRLAMIHPDRRPRRGHMAAIAAIGRRDVRAGFAGRFGPVVAAYACTKRAGM